jgi:hypothetical protein
VKQAERATAGISAILRANTFSLSVTVPRASFLSLGFAPTRDARACVVSLSRRNRACGEYYASARMPPKSLKRASAPAAAEAADKRARATSAPAAAADEKARLRDAGSLAAFEKWCVDRGFVLHDALELRDVTPPGSTRVSNAAFASADVSVGDVLVEIPKAWCLTPRTGSVSLAIPEEELEDLDEAALILAVMYERAKGEASAWWPYFKRLPQDHEPIPLLWSEDDKKHLVGTDVAARLESDAPALREDHARIMDACRAHAGKLPAFFPDGIAPESLDQTRASKKRADGDETSDEESDSDEAPRLEVEDGPFGFRAFLEAASLVASRAFHVDDASGQGLVPVADLFNHAGGEDEHVHFEDGDEDDDSDEEDFAGSDSESDDARVLAEMRRLAEAEKDPHGAGNAVSFDAFEALEKEGGAKLASNVTTYEDEHDEDTGDANETLLSRNSSQTLRLVAVRSATKNEEIFNAFGDHGNALLLHKYGFVLWQNALFSGGVTISPNQLCDLFGSREVYFEAFAALEGGFAELESDDERDLKDEAETERDEKKKPWESAADATDPGAAAAAAAGWSGGKYEIDASGNLSRDLLLLLTTALADCDEDEDAFFKATGLPPGLEAMNDDALLCAPGVAEAALAVIKMRQEALPRGTVEGDLRKAREVFLGKGNEPKEAAEKAAATNGVAGVPAAFVLRANERATCENALSRLVHRLRRLAGDANSGERSGEDDGPRPAAGRVTDVVPLQDTPYGAVVYLPKRDSFARTKRTEEQR